MRTDILPVFSWCVSPCRSWCDKINCNKEGKKNNKRIHLEELMKRRRMRGELDDELTFWRVSNEVLRGWQLRRDETRWRSRIFPVWTFISLSWFESKKKRRELHSFFSSSFVELCHFPLVILVVFINLFFHSYLPHHHHPVVGKKVKLSEKAKGMCLQMGCSLAHDDSVRQTETRDASRRMPFILKSTERDGITCCTSLPPIGKLTLQCTKLYIYHIHTLERVVPFITRKGRGKRVCVCFTWQVSSLLQWYPIVFNLLTDS